MVLIFFAHLRHQTGSAVREQMFSDHQVSDRKAGRALTSTSEMPGLLLAVLLLCAMATTAIAQMSCPIVNESYGFYGPNSAQATASMAVSTQGICIPKIQPVNDVCVQCRLAAIPVCNCPQGRASLSL